MPKQDRPADPDKLVRETAGRHRTGDGRFVVEGGSASGWFIADAEQADELGLPLLRGPFGTLDEARAAIASARAAPAPKAPARRKPKHPPDRPRARPAELDAERKARRPAGKPELETPPSWLDGLSDADQRRVVEQLLSALHSAGFADADALVRRDFDSDRALVVGRLLAERAGREAAESWRASRWSRAEQRQARGLADRLVKAGANEADVHALAAEVAARSVLRVLGIVRGEGFTPGEGRPARGWRLVELNEDAEPTGRTVDLQE